MSSQRLFGILILAVVALAGIPRGSWGAQLVVGQDYYSVQLLSGMSAAVLQESRARVADQPYARIEKRGAEYALRVGYWESREEAVQAAKALLPKFRGAHARIAPYQPVAIVASAEKQPAVASALPLSTEARALRETPLRQQAEAQAEAGAPRLAESRRDAERPLTPEISPPSPEPAQSQAQVPGMRRGSQLVVGQDYHSVQLLWGRSAAVLQQSLALVADQPYARIDKRGEGYALLVGYWDSRAKAVQAAKVLSPKFRGAFARIANYRPDAIVASAGVHSPKVSVPFPSTPEVSPPRTELAQSQTQVPGLSRELQPNKPELARQIEYQLGAGDSIKVVVFQNPDLTVEARVTENGTISFPLIGEVKVGGLTIPAAEQTIAKALKDGGFIQQPQVNIVLVQIRGYQVAVLGQVNRPGRFPLDTLNVRVSEMIAIAGGIIAATGADVAVLTGMREGRPFRKEIDIAGMFAESNRLQDDLVVAAGDVIFVQRAPLFYIYGEVQRPGSYRVERNMTVRQALAQGGGPTIRGTERWLRLHRRGADGKVEILRPGFNDPVQPEDVLYVRESIF